MMFGLFRRSAKEENGRAALIGQDHRRAYVKSLLADYVDVETELASDRRVHLFAEISPDVILLDCASEGVNPFVALSKLAENKGSAWIVALTDGAVPDGAEEALISLGADTVVDIHDARAVVEAALSKPARDLVAA